MSILMRIVGAAMVVYPFVYLTHYIFHPLYEDAISAGNIWQILNIASAVAILIALAANYRNLRSQRANEGAVTAERLGAYVLFYATAALTIWYFHNWIDLLMLEEGESVAAHTNVIWELIGMMIPLVVGTTGCALWRKAS